MPIKNMKDMPTFTTEEYIKSLAATLADSQAECKRLRDEIKRSTIWADEVSPFTPGQVKDLLDENEAFRTELVDIAKALEVDSFSQSTIGDMSTEPPKVSILTVAKDRMNWRHRWSEEVAQANSRINTLFQENKKLKEQLALAMSEKVK